MRVEHVADPLVGPTAGGGHQPRRIELRDPLGQPLGVELPLTFVEQDPMDDRRMVFAAGDHLRQFDLELLFCLGRVVVARRHVLPDQQAQLVAPVIPPVGLDLDVLAGGVETELFGHLDIVAQCVVGRGGVKSVGPKALVQRLRPGTAACH